MINIKVQIQFQKEENVSTQKNKVNYKFNVKKRLKYKMK